MRSFFYGAALLGLMQICAAGTDNLSALKWTYKYMPCSAVP